MQPSCKVITLAVQHRVEVSAQFLHVVIAQHTLPMGSICYSIAVVRASDLQSAAPSLIPGGRISNFFLSFPSFSFWSKYSSFSVFSLQNQVILYQQKSETVTTIHSTSSVHVNCQHIPLANIVQIVVKQARWKYIHVLFHSTLEKQLSIELGPSTVIYNYGLWLGLNVICTHNKHEFETTGLRMEARIRIPLLTPCSCYVMQLVQ